MIGGNPNDFLDRIYSCQDTVFSFKGITYWFQGYTTDNGDVYMEIFQYQPPSDRDVWNHTSKTISECQKAFINTPLFDGKTFWEVESEITWLDC